MSNSQKHHLKEKSSIKPDQKLLAAPKQDGFIPQNLQQKIYFWEKEVSAKSFYITNTLLLIFGLIFLLGIAFVLNDNQIFLASPKGIANYQTITRRPNSFNLDISNPEDNFLSFENTILVSGKTGPKAIVLISINSRDLVIESSPKGDFSQIINLDTGLNNILINAFDSQGNTKSRQLSVYYSEEAI